MIYWVNHSSAFFVTFPKFCCLVRLHYIFWELMSLFLWKIFQSASLCLTTTTPEQLAFALQWYMKPLARFGVPVAEVIFTLLLSLRFINLVFDEVRYISFTSLTHIWNDFSKFYSKRKINYNLPTVFTYKNEILLLNLKH